MDISNIPRFQKYKVRFFTIFITNKSHRMVVMTTMSRQALSLTPFYDVHNFHSVISSGKVEK